MMTPEDISTAKRMIEAMPATHGHLQKALAHIAEQDREIEALRQRAEKAENKIAFMKEETQRAMRRAQWKA